MKTKGFQKKMMTISVTAYVLAVSFFGYSQENLIQYDHANPVEGDIVVYQGAFNNSYTERFKNYNKAEHAAVFCYIDGEPFVIELSNGSGDGDNLSGVRKRSFESFKAYAEKIGQSVKIHQVATEKTPDEIVADALNYVENPSEFFDDEHPHYDPLKWNCQHFAMLCRTGKAASWQTDILLQGADFLGGKMLSEKRNQQIQDAYATVVKHQGHIGKAYNFLKKAWYWYKGTPEKKEG